ncbi:SMI1/KNR4 family protein [Myxococcus qinghaiensis]|uniref:SMI1/KNR4 family protein n=1 Tax=Myxococcus qinghaiensis TaxID=2906758 RepID=UPI0020A76EE3|nr:SMI1/KNR4 family protein [Myxococcus qinghaiensis]MCP3168131.1 SMI1/KNR4 family protein [Myxococcus qinghaiensis]
MHEWLQALRKSAKAASSGVSADEVRWAETECGVPFPEDLGHLYLSFNGGEFHGDVSLFPLHGPEGSVSVLEKTRLKLEGLPAAGVWRIGMKGTHRHLFSARKSAMVEQGDGGGPLPGWVQALGDEEWIFGTWEGEKREMRLYRTLKEMLDVLVPPAEVESFGERTFARALNAVLQGALSGVAADDEEEVKEEGVEEEVLVEAEEEEDPGAQRELAYEYDDDMSRGRKGDESVGFGKSGAKVGGGKKAPLKAAVTQVELFVRPTMQEALRKELGPEKKAPKKKPSAAQAPETKSLAEPVAKKAKAKEAVLPVEVKPASPPPAEPVAKKAKAKEAVTPAGVKPASAPQAEPVAKKAKAKEVATPLALAPVTSAVNKAAGKEPAAKKAPAKVAAEKKVPAKAPAKKPAAKKAPAKKPAAKKAPAKKPAAKRAPAKSAVKKPASKKAVAKGAAKKAGAKKVAAKKAVTKSTAKKAPTKKAKTRR